MPTRYEVYKKSGSMNDWSYFSSVRASTQLQAMQLAKRKYGTPIKVKKE